MVLSEPDSRQLRAAVGWLELGNWREANEELERISPLMRAHPDVLQVRCKVYCAAEKWDYAAEVANGLCKMLPDSAFGPLHLAQALRQLERTREAREALLPVVVKFPDEWRIPFQLACFESKLGGRKEALQWLQRAIDVAGKVEIRLQALEAPDLEPLWTNISKI